MSNIVEVVVADRNLATLLRSFKATGMEAELGRPGPYTLLAPIEIAFGKVSAKEFLFLLRSEDKIKLTAILNDHIVQGKFHFDDFFDGQKLKTIGGKALSVKISNHQVSINGSIILGRDFDADNGVVHSMNSLLAMS